MGAPAAPEALSSQPQFIATSLSGMTQNERQVALAASRLPTHQYIVLTANDSKYQ